MMAPTNPAILGRISHPRALSHASESLEPEVERRESVRGGSAVWGIESCDI